MEYHFNLDSAKRSFCSFAPYVAGCCCLKLDYGNRDQLCHWSVFSLGLAHQMNLAETIYANLVAHYADLSKAKDEDLQHLAVHACRAAQIFEEMTRVV